MQYTGESMNPDGMIALLDYREDGVTRMFLHWIYSVTNQLMSITSLLHLLEGWPH